MNSKLANLDVIYIDFMGMVLLFNQYLGLLKKYRLSSFVSII